MKQDQTKEESRPRDRKATSVQEARSPTPGGSRRNVQIGIVVKAKMQKSVVVAVERMVQHAVYRKTIKRTSTFMAHDEKGAKKGDTVRIVETRPLSKLKRWRVEEIVSRAALRDEEVAVLSETGKA
jgi:small subunit ribosomal protein S17